MGVSHSYNSGDADFAALAFGTVSTTTLATSVTALALTYDRRNVQYVNSTDKIIVVARLRPLPQGGFSTKECAVVPAGSICDVDLFANKNGYNTGDVLKAYAPVVPTSGTFYVTAQ